MNELYSGNNHFAILTEENGDDKLDKETANTIEIGAGVNLKNLRVSANWYNTSIKIIFFAHTGISRNTFIVKEWRSDDTEINGIEAEATYKTDLGKIGKWEIGGYYDLVKKYKCCGQLHKKVGDGDYMPNMPTSRFGFSLEGNVQNFSMNISLDHYLKQKYLGKNINPELPMPAFFIAKCTFSL